MIASRQIAFGRGAAKGISAKDYVQDGLVAMWDGIENAGWGKHDDSATVWKDLVGDMDVAYDTTLGYLNHHWEHDSLVFDNYRDKGFLGSPNGALKEAIEKCVLSVEGCFWTNNTGSNNSCVMQVSSGGLFDGLGFCVSSSTRIESNISDAWASGRATIIFGSSWNFNNKKIAASYVCDGNNGNFAATMDDSKYNAVNALTPPVAQGQLATSLRIGSYSWTGGSTRIFLGGIHNIRIYNRALTAKEIAHNYEIDKARFGL